MGTSSGVTHGTATKMNPTGKAKWRSPDLPPTYHRYKRVSVTTDPVWSQASGRHSGFAISKRRTGRSNQSAVSTTRGTIAGANKFFRADRSVDGADRAAVPGCMNGHLTKFGRKANGECLPRELALG